MGTLKKIFKLLFIIIMFDTYKSQQKDSYIIIKKSDSIKFEKMDSKYYRLSIYNKANIKYNKERGYNYNNFINGIRVCENCKEEVFYYKVYKSEKPKQYIILTVDNFLNKNSFIYGGSSKSGFYYKKHFYRVVRVIQ